MNERKELAPGTILTLFQDGYSRQYRIINVIGEGTTCIVYEAERMGSVRSPRCRIKECYPRHTQTERTGDVISWNEPSERKMAYQRMRKAHDLMVSLRDDETIGNHIPTTELFEGNGTLYSVMEINHAGTDTIHQIDNVYDLLDIMRVLTEIVSCIHEKGYLHLDLKPANFLARVDPTVGVWMFDVDSFEEISSIREKRVHGISYSKGYAPPEQQSANLDQISEKADIYAIGAILFESVMGRLPGSMDRGSFPEWQFEGPLFEKINPIVKVRLREIFKKTLALKPGRRISTARELAKALTEARDLVQESYLISNLPTSLQVFLGREEELRSIESALRKRIAIVQGVGGIGKTELAKQYARLHSKEYQAVIFSQYNGSVEETLEDIPIQNFYRSEEKRETLRRLMNTNVLWVIDGFDSNETGDIRLLEELECDIIITSRRTWDELIAGATLAVHALSTEEQLQLFETSLGRSLSDIERTDVTEILHYIEGYTLLIPLLAKQLRKGYGSIKNMLRELRGGGIKGASAGAVKHIKNGMELSGPVYNILRGLFDVAQFSESEKDLLATMVMCGNYLVRQDNLITWLGEDCLEALDELIFSGWIQREQRESITYITMHSVLQEIVSDTFTSTSIKMDGLKKYLEHVATKIDLRYKIPIINSPSSGQFLAKLTIEEKDLPEYCATLDLLAGALSVHTLAEPESTEFWLSVSRRLISVYYCEKNNLASISNSINQLISSGVPVSRSSKISAFLTLETIAISQENPNTALHYLQEIKSLVANKDEKEWALFHAGFALYQFLCQYPFGYSAEKLLKIKRLATDVSAIFEELLCDWNGHGLIALVGDKITMLSTVVARQIYKDFRRLAFGEEGNCDEEFFLEINWSIIDAMERMAEETDSGGDKPQEGSKPTSKSLFPIVEILGFAGEFVSDGDPFLLEWVPRPLTKEEHQRVISILQEADSRLGYYPELLEVNEDIVAGFLTQEALFAQAYARINDWEAYAFHAGNLTEYYKAIVQKKYCKNENKHETQELSHILPGYRSLLFDKRLRLPADSALAFVHSLIEQIEGVLVNYPYKNDVLRELYHDGAEIAEKANLLEQKAFFRERYDTTLMTPFLSKDLDKRMQELRKQLEEPRK